MLENRLTRSESDKMIAGVCGGLAVYLNLDPVYVRLAFVVLGFASGIGVPIYLALAVITPRESEATAASIRLEGETTYQPAKRVRNNATFFAALLMVLGVYLLLTNFGLHIGWFGPLLLIGVGAWLLRRRS